MKKIFYSVMMVCAMLATQKANAQESQVIFEESFATGLGEFTVEGDPVWFANSYQEVPYANMCVIGKQDLKGETYFVSPVIANGTDTKFTFDHLVTGVFGGFEDYAGVCVRTEGGEWTMLEGVTFLSGFDQFQGKKTSSGEIVVPAEFDNQNIQIAFVVKGYDSSYGGMWYINNLVVNSVTGEEKPEEPQSEVLYSVEFNTQEAVDSWTKEGSLAKYGDFATLSKDFMAINGYVGENGGFSATYVVSPVVKLADSNNTLSFTNSSFYFQNMPVSDLTALVIRTVGGEWEQVEGAVAYGEYPEFVTSNHTVNSKYDGKEVQFGLLYMNDNGDNCGFLYLKDFTVMGGSVQTGIQNVENAVADNKYYDLQGRVVENPTKGLYIHNGKKIVIK